jgi:hypothetical protein
VVKTIDFPLISKKPLEKLQHKLFEKVTGPRTFAHIIRKDEKRQNSFNLTLITLFVEYVYLPKSNFFGHFTNFEARSARKESKLENCSLKVMQNKLYFPFPVC